jgi:hypothetical protein
MLNRIQKKIERYISNPKQKIARSNPTMRLAPF